MRPWLFRVLGCGTFWGTCLFAAPQITVVGWDFSAVHETNALLDFGNDPVVGRLVCPPLTRLDIHDKGSEAFVLKSISANSDNREWNFTLQPGTLWWSGDQVHANDLKDFISRLLADNTFRERLSVLWSIPEFKVEVVSPNAVRLIWKTAPVFGLYIFDGVAFSRPASATQEERSALKFECVGRYSAKLEQENKAEILLLTPTKSLGGASRSIKLLSQHEKFTEDSNSIVFDTASQVDQDLGAKGLKETQRCTTRLELPYMTMILWNARRPVIKDAAMRRALTQLTPRGELLRTGAGGFGELVSSPIPRSHPGYDPSLKLRSFSLEDAATALDTLGYRRSSPEKSRGGKDGSVLKLFIATQKGSSGLAEKIVSDSFNAVGIELHIESNEGMYLEKYDGQILSWTAPWPALNLAQVFHSHAKHPWQVWLPHQSRLDNHLEDYALSLSKGTPKYQSLRMAHKELFELEPVTVLMQHKACLRAGRGFAKTGRIDVRDPDWFWQLIL